MPYDPTGLEMLKVVSPLRETVRALVIGGQELNGTNGVTPAADSPGMRELAAEASFAGAWSADPLHLAQTIAGMCVAAAEDHVLTLCAVLSVSADSEQFRGPVFGHLALARAAAEAAGRGAWLLESGIGYEQRAARAVGELLYSRVEQARATGDWSTVEVYRSAVRDECTARSLAFKFDKGGRITVGEDRPGMLRSCGTSSVRCRQSSRAACTGTTREQLTGLPGRSSKASTWRHSRHLGWRRTPAISTRVRVACSLRSLSPQSRTDAPFRLVLSTCVGTIRTGWSALSRSRPRSNA